MIYVSEKIVAAKVGKKGFGGRGLWFGVAAVSFFNIKSSVTYSGFQYSFPKCPRNPLLTFYRIFLQEDSILGATAAALYTPTRYGCWNLRLGLYGTSI
jgi:hypothetical protein